MKILFLAPYPANESPSQRYRFEQYFSFLDKNEIAYTYKTFLNMPAWAVIFKPRNYFKKIWGLSAGFLRRWLLLFTIGKYDYVFIHREAAPMGPPIFEWIIAKIFRKKIIYDFDDAIWIPVASQYNKAARYFKWFSKIATICRLSYKVSAGNAYLAAFAANYNKRVVVVPTVVNTELVHNSLQDQVTAHPQIGWTGTFSTLKYLDMILPVLQRLQNKFDFTFIVIADKDPVLPLKNYKFIRWQKETEAKDLLTMHIGLMPLFDDELSKGKCGFKAIQYMALGIPAVVSPVGVNAIIVDDGLNGYVCNDEQEWERRLTDLLTQPSLRQQMGKESRKKIEENYSVSATQNLFMQLFQ